MQNFLKLTTKIFIICLAVLIASAAVYNFTNDVSLSQGGDVSDSKIDCNARTSEGGIFANVALAKCITYDWMTWWWSDCSVNCGWGTKWRDVLCYRQMSGWEYRVSDYHCRGRKPSERTRCYAGNCSHGSGTDVFPYYYREPGAKSVWDK